jgi:hypothetical protein
MESLLLAKRRYAERQLRIAAITFRRGKESS